MADNSQSGGWRRVVVEKPFGEDLASAQGAERPGRLRLHRPGRLPDRPLPGQGDGPEPAGAALRQRAVRADLEPPAHRLGADHHGRGRRHRGPGRLLRADRRGPRRAAEPPAAAARADRHGGARLVRRREPADREAQGARRGHAAQRPGRYAVRGQYDQGWLAGERVKAYRAEQGVDPRVGAETYAAVRLEVESRRWAGVPFYLRTGKRLPRRVTEIAVLFRKAPVLPFCADRHRGARQQPARRAGPARRGDDAALRLQGARHADGGPRRRDGLPLRRGVHREQPGGVRAAAARRPARRRLAVPAQRGGRAELAGHRPDRAVLGRAPRAQGPHLYRAGEWGPKAADEMLARDGRAWRRPT